jgi:hypothetical protein
MVAGRGAMRDVCFTEKWGEPKTYNHGLGDSDVSEIGRGKASSGVRKKIGVR